MKRIRLFQIMSLALIAGLVPLGAQGYETKFKAVGFKPGDAYQSDENVQVSLNGGGLEVSIPLGPALPGPIPIRPVVHYHGKYVQSLNSSTWPKLPSELDGNSCVDNGDITGYRRWLVPKNAYGEIHPGYLLFSVGALPSLPGDSTITVTSHGGESAGYYLGMPGTYTFHSDVPNDVTEINSLVTALAPEWTPMAAADVTCTPSWANTIHSQPLGKATGMRLSGGGVLIFGPSNGQIYSSFPLDSNGANILPVYALIVSIPREILQIDGDLITLWRKDRNVNHKVVEIVPVGPSRWVDMPPMNPPLTGTRESLQWDRSVFHPVWIKTRSGFKVNVEIYRSGFDCVQERGDLWGYKVSSNNGATWFQVGGPSGMTSASPVTFGGMGSPGTTGLTLIKDDEGLGTFGEGRNWQPGTTSGYGNCPPLIDEGTRNYAALGFSADSITYGGMTTSFQWGGPQGQLSKLTTPTGKTYSFSYDLFAGIGPNSSCAVSGVRAWDYHESMPGARNFWSFVTRMDVSDGEQTRSTTYNWRIPQVDPTSVWPASNWISHTQGVAQTLPDGQTILHVFAPTIDLPAATLSAQFYPPLSTTVLDQSARTFMAQRQTVIARYYYVQKETSWNGFIANGTDPASSNWYKRELLEGFDLRSWEAALTQITSNTEPRPTRFIREEQGGPVEVTELDGWDASRNQYAASRVYHLLPGTITAGQFWAPGLFGGTGMYPSASGSTDLATTLTTFAPIELGLYARPQEKISQQVSAPPSGCTGTISDTHYDYYLQAQAHLIKEIAQKATDGSSLQLNTDFSYGVWGGFTRVNGVTLSASGISGSAGYTYDYDDTGRWLTSIQNQGVTYKEKEPDHDWGGRPTTYIDANGVTSTYEWDDLGRINWIRPPSPELPTHVEYSSDFKTATVTRGGISTQYNYNSFGELTSVQKPTGEAKTFQYDRGGRKTFESVWSSTTVGTNYYFDTQGRLKQTVTPNGEISDIVYSNPLIKTVTQYPNVYGQPSNTITTFGNDALGRLATVTNAKGEVTKYTYDAAGKLTKVEQGVQARNWGFNGLGWLHYLVQPESGTTTYSDWNLFGKPTKTNYAGRVINTTYDVLGRATDIIAADGSVSQHFEFDGGAPYNGKLRYSTDRSGLDQTLLQQDYGYGGLNGRLDSLKTTLAPVAGNTVPPFTQSFTYDNFGHLHSTTLPNGRVVRSEWDSARELPSSVFAPSGVPGAFGGENQLASVSTFDPANNPLSIVFANGASTAFSYCLDQLRLHSITHAKAGVNAFTNTWTYDWDSAGWLKGDSEDSYTYDELERLVTASVKLPSSVQAISQNFTYDSYGNRISNTFPFGVPSQLSKNLVGWTMNVAEIAQMGLTNHFPSTAGNVATGAQYDSQGNLSQANKQPGSSSPYVSLGYDSLGRVVQMVDSELGTTELYFYTAEGLRTRIETYQGTQFGSRVLLKVTIMLYNDKRQLVSQYSMVNVP